MRYLNSGDWVESLSAIVEHHDGKLELVRYEDFMAELAAEAECREEIFPDSTPVCHR